MSRFQDLPIWDPLRYLTVEESQEIEAQLETSLDGVACLLFWTGVSHELVKRWANTWGLKTLTMAMGPLIDANNANSAKCKKNKKRFQKYVKGASIKFAQYACEHCQVVVLTNPPPHVYSPRENSTYRELEEPILKGKFGHAPVHRIYYVHPTVTEAAHVLYQTWPIDRHVDWASLYGTKQVKKKLQKIRWEEHLLITTSQSGLKTKKAPRGAAPAASSNQAEPSAKENPRNVKPVLKHITPVAATVIPASTDFPNTSACTAAKLSADDKETHAAKSDSQQDGRQLEPKVFPVEVINYSKRESEIAEIELFCEIEVQSQIKPVSILRCLVPVDHHSVPVVDIDDLGTGSDITVDLGNPQGSRAIFLRSRRERGSDRWWVLQWM